MTQKELDAACEWLANQYDYANEEYLADKIQEFRKAMEGISGNKKEIPSNSCNSDKNLQAIEILSVLRSLYEGNVGDKELKTHEAFSLAIEALKNQ